MCHPALMNYTNANISNKSHLNFLDSPFSDWGPLENNESTLVIACLLIRAELDLCHLLSLVVPIVNGGHHGHLLLLLHVAIGGTVGIPRAGAAAGRHL